MGQVARTRSVGGRNAGLPGSECTLRLRRSCAHLIGRAAGLYRSSCCGACTTVQLAVCRPHRATLLAQSRSLARGMPRESGVGGPLEAGNSPPPTIGRQKTGSMPGPTLRVFFDTVCDTWSAGPFAWIVPPAVGATAPSPVTMFRRRGGTYAAVTPACRPVPTRSQAVSVLTYACRLLRTVL
jgi:hypothetical protein